LRVFFVEDNKDSVKTALFLGVFPETIVAFSFRAETCDSNSTPVAELVLVTPETLSSDTLFSRVLAPRAGKSSVHLVVVISFKGKPATKNFLRVTVFNTRVEEQLFD
jgi:hypothetical protein